MPRCGVWLMSHRPPKKKTQADQIGEKVQGEMEINHQLVKHQLVRHLSNHQLVKHLRYQVSGARLAG